MSNLLNVVPDYQITRTVKGVRRRYLYENEASYSEWTSHARLFGPRTMHVWKERFH